MPGAIVGDIVGSVYEFDNDRAYGKKYPSSYGNRFQDWITVGAAPGRDS